MQPHSNRRLQSLARRNSGGKGKSWIPRWRPFEIKSGRRKDRHVVIEFDSYEQALACYDSPEYQSAAKFRDQGAQVDLVIIERMVHK